MMYDALLFHTGVVKIKTFSKKLFTRWGGGGGHKKSVYAFDNVDSFRRALSVTLTVLSSTLHAMCCCHQRKTNKPLYLVLQCLMSSP